jgi:hypothetical protein
MSLSRVRLFLSYSRADAEYHRELLVHLRPLSDLVDVWHDQQIQPGTDWKRAIDEALTAADLVVLLISPDFLASDFCVNTELQRAFFRWSSKEVFIVPIVVRHCAWAQTPLSALQVLCAEQPIGTLERRASRDAEWNGVARHIGQLASRAMAVKTSALPKQDLGTRRVTAPAIRTSSGAASDAGIFSEVASLRTSTKMVLAIVTMLATVGLVSLAGLLSGVTSIGVVSLGAPTPAGSSNTLRSPTYEVVDAELGELVSSAEFARTIVQDESTGETRAVAVSISWFERAQAAFKKLETPNVISEAEFVNNVKLRGLRGLEDPENRKQADQLLRKGISYIAQVRQDARLQKRLFGGNAP